MKKNKKCVMLIFCGMLLILSYLAVIQQSPATVTTVSDETLTQKLDPYYIDISSKTDFDNEKDRGTGTPEDPYVIENRVVNLSGDNMGGISIFGTGYHFIIQNCVFIGDEYYSGIEIWTAHNGTLINNTLTNFRYGISVKGASNINITYNNLSNNNWRGLELAYVLTYSQFIRVINNTMVANKLQSGCRVDWVYNCTFINNTCNDNGAKGFWLKNAKYNVVENNVANDNGDYGFLVEYAHFNNFTYNSADGNPVDGVRCSNSIYNNFINFTVNDSGHHGFDLTNASHSKLINNTVTNNGEHGFLITYYSSYNTITFNTMRNNGWMCLFQDTSTCTGNIIANNDCDEAGDGGVPGFGGFFAFLGILLLIYVAILLRNHPKHWNI